MDKKPPMDSQMDSQIEITYGRGLAPPWNDGGQQVGAVLWVRYAGKWFRAKKSVTMAGILWLLKKNLDLEQLKKD